MVTILMIGFNSILVYAMKKLYSMSILLIMLLPLRKCRLQYFKDNFSILVGNASAKLILPLDVMMATLIFIYIRIPAS
jgi:hypothetical protein